MHFMLITVRDRCWCFPKLPSLALGQLLRSAIGIKRLIGVFPLTGDITVKTICYWLCQRNPSGSTLDLLTRAWELFNPTPAADHAEEGTCKYTNICEEILACDDVYENCMCGYPVVLKEVRFGRCQLGHVWPRCCVTFKLLDGTNARVCENCNAHALNRHPINSPYQGWTKNLLDATFSCTFCGGWFEEA